MKLLAAAPYARGGAKLIDCQVKQVFVKQANMHMFPAIILISGKRPH